MAYTKVELLNAFCLAHRFAQTKLVDETKQAFLERKQKDWALNTAIRQLEMDAMKSARATIKADAEATGL